MLIEFSVANFLSFKTRVTLSLEATNDTTLEESNVSGLSKHRLLRSAVVYGANASGKSNLLHAITVMRRMALTSSKDTQANEEIEVSPFLLSTESEGKPSAFEIVFLHEGVSYRYGFEADRKRIHSEWLFTRPTTKEANLFLREETQISVNADRFKEGKGLEERTRENALFLSVCAQFNGEISSALLRWFQNLRILSGFAQPPLYGVTVDRLRRAGQKQRVLELTRVADPGITDLDVVQRRWTELDFPKDMPDELKTGSLSGFPRGFPTVIELKTTHRKVDAATNAAGSVIFDLDENESGGTQKLVKMTGPLLDTLETGKVLVVDELDARLHPLLTRLIVSLFNSSANPANAQLIFASHDTSLLTPKLFRRDQIWFTEKDRHGSTDLYALAELRGVRKEAAFGKDYILGRYGSIPFIGEPEWLFSENQDE